MENRKLNYYILAIDILALICVVVAYLFFKNDYFMLSGMPIDYMSIILFIFLDALAESLNIKYNLISVSTAFAVTTASVLDFGIFWSIIIVSFGIALRIIKYNGAYYHIFNTPINKIVFNMANMTISAFCSGLVFYSFLGRLQNADVIVLMIKFILFIFTFLIINTTIISLLISFISDDRKVFKIFANNFKLGFLNIIFIAPLGIIFMYLYSGYSLLGAVIMIAIIISLRFILKIYIQ